MSSAIVDINNDTEAKAASLLDSSPVGQKRVLFFWAEWHAPSAAGGPFNAVVKALAGQSGSDGVTIYRVLAEEAPTLSQKVSLLTADAMNFLHLQGNVWKFEHITCMVPHLMCMKLNSILFTPFYEI